MTCPVATNPTLSNDHCTCGGNVSNSTSDWIAEQTSAQGAVDVSPQRQMARMRAWIVAYYKLTAVPGRPEELVLPGTDLGVSLGYGCRTIRVRTMKGRTWSDWHDYQLGPGWLGELAGQLTRHFKPLPKRKREGGAKILAIHPLLSHGDSRNPPS
jgi:hypothetical protein